MLARISLITAVGGAALMLAVPSAWGKGQLGQTYPPDAVERALAQQQGATGAVSTYRDAFERAALPSASPDGVATYRDAAERAVSGRIQSGALSGHTDRYELDLPNGTVLTPSTGSGREVEWPQVGVGFGLGLLLALGLVLAVGHPRRRTLAHG
jgi:hypothetical protein